MSAGIMVPLLKDPEGAFGWNIFTVSAAISLYYLVGSLMSPVAGMLGDRFGSRPIMFACGLLYLISMLFVGIVTETWHFFIAFGVLLRITSLHLRPLAGLRRGLVPAPSRPSPPACSRAPGALAPRCWPRRSLPCWTHSDGSLLSGSSHSWEAGLSSFAAFSSGQSRPMLASGPMACGETIRRKSRRPWICSSCASRCSDSTCAAPAPSGRQPASGCAGHGIVLIFVIDYAKEVGIDVTQGAWILFFISFFSIVGRFVVPVLAERFGGKPVMMVFLFPRASR